ncbi:MAG: DUF971 domain-containing protein, partial [Planctomycetota bacterium]
MTHEPPASPTSLDRTPTGLRITWSDGQVRDYTAGQLRDGCPCATCREKRSAPPPPAGQLTVLSAAEARPLRVEGMRPAGAYAYNIRFSDGHNTGLFTFERLRELGAEVAGEP